MIFNTGRTPATSQIQDGSIIHIFNYSASSARATTGQIAFYDVVGNKKYVVNTQSIENPNYRIASFARSLSHTTFHNTIRMVILNKSSEEASQQYLIPAFPIYQLISPNITNMGYDSYQLTWWCNTDKATEWMTEKNPDGITYKYNDVYVKKFNLKQLDKISEPTSTSAKVLCTAALRWQKLAQVGGGAADIHPKFMPVISDPVVLTFIKDEGYVTDFSIPGSGQGEGTGLGIHAHTAINDGGFAAAIFMPSAIMKPFNWS